MSLLAIGLTIGFPPTWLVHFLAEELIWETTKTSATFYCEDILNETSIFIINRFRTKEDYMMFFLPEFPLTFDLWIFVGARHQRSI